MPVAGKSLYKTKTALIDVSESTTVSTAVDTDGLLLAGIRFDASITCATITFQVTSTNSSGTFMNLVETDGTETERTVSGVTSEKTSASKSENYIGGSIFAETEYAGLTVGLDVVPFKIKLGDGKRTDTTSDANETTQEDGTVTAEANLDYLTTIYAHYPIGDWYAGLGYHMTKVSTDEEALSLANHSDFGLLNGVWTNNLSRAHNLARDLESGMGSINEYPITRHIIK